MKSVASLLLLVSLLVEVHSQTFPMSPSWARLANHSYVDLTLVGRDGSGSNSVQCHTDLGTHVVIVAMVPIVETGISLMEIDCNSLMEMMIPVSKVKL